MGQNEVWFREVNERLETRALRERPIGATFEIVCECDREQCTVRIVVGFHDYESVRAQGGMFIVAPGHIDLTVERLVSRSDSFDVVSKIGAAAEVAEEADPRAD